LTGILKKATDKILMWKIIKKEATSIVDWEKKAIVAKQEWAQNISRNRF
jgi:hypothetical protein